MRVQGAECRVQSAGCRVQGAGCRVQGAGCRVHPATSVCPGVDSFPSAQPFGPNAPPQQYLIEGSIFRVWDFGFRI